MASAASREGRHDELETISWILDVPRTWAIVGCSPDPARDSHRVAATLAREGNRVIPVNPQAENILGERCFASLSEITEREDVEVVDIFRRSELAGQHGDEAIEIGAQAVWDATGGGRRSGG